MMVWQAGISGISANLFNGTSSSITTLHNLTQNDKFEENSYLQLKGQDIQAIVSKSVYGILMPMAWSPLPADYFAEVIDGNGPWGTVQPSQQYIDDSDASATFVCYDINSYYPVALVGLSETRTAGKDVGISCTK